MAEFEFIFLSGDTTLTIIFSFIIITFVSLVSVKQNKKLKALFQDESYFKKIIFKVMPFILLFYYLFSFIYEFISINGLLEGYLNYIHIFMFVYSLLILIYLILFFYIFIKVYYFFIFGKDKKK